MKFDFDGAVAIVTGGASGIGLACVKALLKRNVKGVTIVDINESLGGQVLSQLSAEFVSTKCHFVSADTTDKGSFRNAFEKTIERFGAVDILINSAGLCNDAIWEREVAVNVCGTINGNLLGLEEFIPKYRSKAEGVIINVSSIRGVQPSGDRPVYAATKFAIHGMSLAWGEQNHYQRTNVKVIAVCPGSTATPLIANPKNTNLGTAYEEIRQNNSNTIKLPRQSPEECAARIVEVIETGESGSVWIVEGGEKYQYVMPDRFEVKEQQQ
ncbi:hypothetical protein GWI33_004240 [Rhynchophorus ferrugineus]|uniref:15-hydroxyprostaglandin dehydrogenase n=1 Tax=Rhynchophorus ferrugineus TaxID=354439 RepID=A0A834MGY2_RHYFE|nr:hypothetical protein GWI33_004240 [Rhynchophorus ferrugineus]